MKAIILAAGIGSRLRPITHHKPKALVEVNNKPILSYAIDGLTAAGINHIIICTGFRHAQLVNYCESTYPGLNFTFVENTAYEDTNNMYSLYLAREHLNDDLILMNADVAMDPEIISSLASQDATAVAVDTSLWNEESMKITVQDERITGIAKTITEHEAFGCSIDIYRIAQNDTPTIIDCMQEIIEKQQDKNQWTEVMLNRLFESDAITAQPHEITGKRWYEIDNYEDLATAEVLFNEKTKMLHKRRIYFLDRDGTLTLDNTPLPGVEEFLQAIHEKGDELFVITNNSAYTPQQHLKRFQQAGLDLNIDQVLTSTQATLLALRQEGIERLYWIANNSVSEYIQSGGFIFADEKPQALLLTYDTELTYDKLCDFIAHVRQGTPYYATHIDMVCPTESGPIPDIGCFIQLIKEVTGVEPNKVFGKPEKSLIDSILKEKGLTYSDAVVIGDRLYTDIALADDSDMLSVLVLTGETQREDYEESPIKADIVVPTLQELLPFLNKHE